ncbi:dihydrolipoyl dehydrogenase [Acuticoccus sp.]|uniref:dihydrolipoyl dehydrogenase n=1 Tax=Acuticoccus sp. TaxID=1904378 RepID=UPI003B529728
MSERTVDVAVIGAGTAGMSAMRMARKATDSVLLIEEGPYGTTCARVGCMPSKLLIAAAAAAQHARGASTFGIDVGEPKVDGRAVMERVRTLRDRFVSHVLDGIDGLPRDATLTGRARFDGDTRLLVDVDGREVVVNAKAVVIATGSSAVVPDTFRATKHETSDDVFEWTDLPASVAVFGGGIIGLEIGQALSRLGVNVRLFGKDDVVGPLTDEGVLEAARAHFTSVLDFVPDHTLHSIDGGSRGATVRYAADGRDFAATYDTILVTIGRTPNVADLNLASTSLEFDDDGVPRYDRSSGRCGDAPIYIAGDVMNDAPLLHEAAATGRIAGANSGLEAPRPNARYVPLTVVYCEPQIAMVGETHRELIARGAAFSTGVVDWSEQGRAIVMNEAAGRAHVYTERGSCRVLGAEMFGPRAEHLAHTLALAMQHGMTVQEIIAAPTYHPTFEEGLRSALERCLSEQGLADAPLPHGLSSGPGG